MSAILAVSHLLENDASLIAVVPAARQFGGLIPQGTALPALAITSVSTVRRQEVNADNFCIERVQVTVHAATYPQQKQVLALVRAALPRRPGTVNTVKVDSILTDTTGPDFRNDSVDPPIFMGEQDFMVRYSE
jgi:hypothetical protein